MASVVLVAMNAGLMITVDRNPGRGMAMGHDAYVAIKLHNDGTRKFHTDSEKQEQVKRVKAGVHDTAAIVKA